MRYTIREYRPCTLHPDCPGHFDIESVSGDLLTGVPLPIDRLEEGKRVVRACNRDDCFDELLAACRHLLQCLESEGAIDNPRLATDVREARAAIAKAEAQP